MSAILRARQRGGGRGGVYDPLTDSEINLFNSPYGKPILGSQPLPQIRSHSTSPPRAIAGGGAGASFSPGTMGSPTNGYT